MREHARSELRRQRPWNLLHRSPFGQRHLQIDRVFVPKRDRRLSLDRDCAPKLQPRGSVELALGPIGVP